jgi:hypothetical protein
VESRRLGPTANQKACNGREGEEEGGGGRRLERTELTLKKSAIASSITRFPRAYTVILGFKDYWREYERRTLNHTFPSELQLLVVCSIKRG